MTAVLDEKTRYSEDELKEFEELIMRKLETTRNEFNFIKETLSRKHDNGTDYTAGSTKMLEDGADVSEKESLSQSAVRLQKFAQQLEAGLIRIKNGTYGVCKDTGRLIPKERLRAVPHTQQTIEAKLRASN
jgi:DnaK suppressor protein